MRIIIVVGFLLASCSLMARADEFYKNAAYCIGGLRSKIDSADRDVKASDANVSVLNYIRDLKMNIFVHETSLKHAIERGEIDAVTASKVKRVGYDDGNTCDNGLDKCLDELQVRKNQKIGNEPNNKLFQSCIVEPMKLCDQIKKACEE